MKIPYKMIRSITFITTIAVVLMVSGCGSGDEQTKERIRPVKSLIIGDIPFTSRAKKVLEFAVEEARSLNHNYIGTEHR